MGADLDSLESGDGPISGINVTPFVDVVLVLLVIFMLTAPALIKDLIKIDLPKSSTAEKSPSANTIGIAITTQGQILLNGQIIDEGSLSTFLKAEVTKNADSQVVIAADGDSKHTDLIRVIDLVKQNGIKKFGLQVTPK